MSEALSVVVALAMFVFVGLIYFWPTIAAVERRNDAAFGVFMLNLFGGWTLIGWVVAIVWAYHGRR